MKMEMPWLWVKSTSGGSQIAVYATELCTAVFVVMLYLLFCVCVRVCPVHVETGDQPQWCSSGQLSTLFIEAVSHWPGAH